MSIVVVIDSWPSLAWMCGQRRTAGDQPRDMGVPQIMKPERRDMPSAATAVISFRHIWV